jgi:hypothetical protein
MKREQPERAGTVEAMAAARTSERMGGLFSKRRAAV